MTGYSSQKSDLVLVAMSSHTCFNNMFLEMLQSDRNVAIFCNMRDKKIGDAIPDYLQWRKRQGFAANTTRNDESALGFLTRTLSPERLVTDIYPSDISDVLDACLNKRQPSSVNAVHATLSGFFQWCRANQIVSPDHNPMLGVRYKKVAVKERNRLRVDEFGAFLDASPDPRHRMMASLGIYLFLRSSEAISLRIQDVDLTEGTVGVTVHKTNDFDRMPISAELDRELRQWLTHYRNVMGPLDPNWKLVPPVARGFRDSNSYNPIGKISKPEDMIKRCLDSYGWADTHWEGMHCLRRSGARAWFDTLVGIGTDGALRLVQTQLHHRSVTMTERYLGLTGDRINRDKRLKGQAMFPISDRGNVVPLQRVAER